MPLAAAASSWQTNSTQVFTHRWCSSWFASSRIRPPTRIELSSFSNSHDATLLGEFGTRLLGRDQIWFTEKNRDGATRVYPLTDLDPRKDEAIGRRYLTGRYGAVPILSDQEFSAAARLITANHPE